MSVDPEPRGPVQPKLHSQFDIEESLTFSTSRPAAIIESIAYYAVNNMWEDLWHLADKLKREVSVLFDSRRLVWVDIGTIGRVKLAPPIGSQLPLRLWVHTHPRDAYWSETDKTTLGFVSGILDCALVLGYDHLVKTEFQESVSVRIEDCRIAASGPLAHWTDEAAVSYSNLV
ncbi:MAG: hypothetical protein CMB37_03650 [Euryarchaeota archaeon]|nr:hypothetical protein [Euryarchaeota archaeon]MEC7704777.1 hypothetical protein [Candidatus Thermoplasmatota archaeon]